MKARRVTFPRDWAWSFIVGKKVKVSSCMVDKNSRYHGEAFLLNAQIFLSRAHGPATVQQRFVSLDFGRKLRGHSLKKSPSDF